MKKIHLVIPLILILGIGIGLIMNISADEGSIPSWIKNSARWWADGQISDADFIKSLQWLIDNKILKVPSFDSVKTSKEPTNKEQESNQLILNFLDRCTKAPNDVELKKCIDLAKYSKKYCDDGMNQVVSACNDSRLAKLSDLPKMTPFTDLSCNQEYGFVKMTGRYTNDMEQKDYIGFILGIVDSKGKVVATGLGGVKDISPQETKLFEAIAVYGGEFDHCEIQEK